MKTLCEKMSRNKALYEVVIGIDNNKENQTDNYQRINILAYDVDDAMDRVHSREPELPDNYYFAQVILIGRED